LIKLKTKKFKHEVPLFTTTIIYYLLSNGTLLTVKPLISLDSATAIFEDNFSARNIFLFQISNKAAGIENNTK